MTPAELKNYLVALRSGGAVAVGQLNQMADVAMETGFQAVWGAREWKVRRVEKDITLTANQTYTSLPDDTETVIDVRLTVSTQPISIDLKEENSFNYDNPYPGANQAGLPREAKVVWNQNGAQGDRWRIYWWRIPDSAYTGVVTYFRKGDITILPTLPSYMLEAIIERCVLSMLGDTENRGVQLQVANAALSRAMDKDSILGGYNPRLGTDPGWDDWVSTSGGSYAWDPRS